MPAIPACRKWSFLATGEFESFLILEILSQITKKPNNKRPLYFHTSASVAGHVKTTLVSYLFIYLVELIASAFKLHFLLVYMSM